MKLMPWTEKRSMVLQTVPRRVLCLRDSGAFGEELSVKSREEGRVKLRGILAGVREANFAPLNGERIRFRFAQRRGYLWIRGWRLAQESTPSAKSQE